MVFNETFELWQKNSCQMSGYASDGSRTKECDSELILVPDSEVEDFMKDMATEYGYQDYNYRVNYKLLADTIFPDALKDLKQQIEEKTEAGDALASIPEDAPRNRRII